METTAVTVEDLHRSVLAVPPLARRADLALDEDHNACIVGHLRARRRRRRREGTVRENPADGANLGAIVDAVGADRVISGIGERPAITHWTRFGLHAFTSGAVCIAPALSTAIFRAPQVGDVATAGTIRSQFLPFEDLRDAHSSLRVLHEGVRLAGIAETGPMQPLLSNIDDESLLGEIGRAAVALLAANGTGTAKAA